MARQIERVHRCGPRAIGELLTEIIAKIGAANPNLAAFASERLERYAELDPATVQALGGDRIPSTPIHLVRA